MMITRFRFLASSFGSAEMPSSSGISMSSTATSGLMRSIWLTASSPVRNEAATTMSGSAPSQREIMPLMTTESSTNITRRGSGFNALGTAALVNATLILTNRTQLTGRIKATLLRHDRELASRRAGRRKSDQADFLKFGRDNVLVERLHDVFVGAGMKRAGDVGDIVFRRAEHHLGLVAARHAAEIAEELVAVHDRHVPVQQDRLWQRALADLKCFLAVFGFYDLK